MTGHDYPQPREDADNRAFLQAWRNGELHIQHCQDCGRSIFYPRSVCPHCWSGDVATRKASGRGRIVSYSLVLRPNDPAFNDEVPIMLVEVALEEGALVLARVIGCDAAAIRSGLAVELPAPEIATRFPLPVFQLVKAA